MLLVASTKVRRNRLFVPRNSLSLCVESFEFETQRPLNMTSYLTGTPREHAEFLFPKGPLSLPRPLDTTCTSLSFPPSNSITRDLQSTPRPPTSSRNQLICRQLKGRQDLQGRSGFVIVSMGACHGWEKEREARDLTKVRCPSFEPTPGSLHDATPSPLRYLPLELNTTTLLQTLSGVFDPRQNGPPQTALGREMSRTPLLQIIPRKGVRLVGLLPSI